MPCPLRTEAVMLVSWILFLICESGCLFRKDSGLASCCRVESFEFRVLFPLDWLPIKVGKSNLLGYLTHGAEKNMYSRLFQGY